MKISFTYFVWKEHLQNELLEKPGRFILEMVVLSAEVR